MTVSNYGAGADSARVQLYYTEETGDWGQTPATALKALRMTGESLAFSRQDAVSDEIRSDRQISDLTGVSTSVGGGIDIELSHGAYDDFFEGALFGAWGADVAVSDATIEADNAGSAFTSAGLDFTAQNIVIGQKIKVGGFDTAGANGIFTVTDILANTLSVTPAPDADTNAGANTIAISGKMLRNGVVPHAYTLERLHADTSQYFAFTGMMVADMGLDFSVGSMIKGRFSFMGKDAQRSAASVGTGQPLDAETGVVTNTVSNIGHLMEGDSAMTAPVRSLSVAVANNLRPQNAVGSEALAGIGLGRCQVSGSLEAYFTDGDLYDLFRSGNTTSLSWRITDADGAAYVVTLPRVKLTNAAINAGSADQDVMASFQYQALRDEVSDCTIQIDRL